MRCCAIILLGLAAFVAVNAEVFYEENFLDGEFNEILVRIFDFFVFGWSLYNLISCFFYHAPDKWQDTWIYSKHPGKEFGKFVRTAGKFFNDEKADKGESSHKY